MMFSEGRENSDCETAKHIHDERVEREVPHVSPLPAAITFADPTIG